MLDRVNKWAVRELTRRRITATAAKLTFIKSKYAASGPWSEMIGNRIQSALSDYWSAVRAFCQDDIEEARYCIATAALAAEFIRQLMDAEVAERELGEGEFFEFSGYVSAPDSESEDRLRAKYGRPPGSGRQIAPAIDRLSFELQTMLAELRALRAARRSGMSTTS